MSTVTSGKRSTTPKKQQRTRSQSQQKSRNQEDVCVRISLPPLVEGPVYAILICHIPKLRWNTKYQSLSRYVNVKVSWWGEDDTSAIFKPQVSGVSSEVNQTPSTTAKYYIRSELKQFARYLTDASELVLKIHDSESNRLIGTCKVQHLSTLSINNSIKGYQSIFNNKGDKLGELFVALRLILPGTHDSNENLATMSCTSDVSNPPSRRNSVSDQLENGSRTYKIDRPINQQFDSTVPFTPYTQPQTDLPTGKVVEALIERANRLREDMIKSSLPTTTTDNYRTLNMNNNNANLDHFDDIINSDNVCDILNHSNDSILSDIDALENEQSLLDDLLFGTRENANSSINSSKNHSKKIHPRGKPPTGRSPSPSLARVGNASARPRSARSRSLAQSSDSDTASRVSFDLPSSDLDDSANESHDDNQLNKERIEILNHVRIARVRIEHLRLNNLNNDRESPSHSSFGRTNKTKRASTYFIEYQFPVIANSRDGQKNEATQAMKIASKRFESNNDIIFSHLSTYPCLFNENILKTWWRSLLIFKIYSRMSGNVSPEQIGFAVLPLRNILKSTNLHYEHNLPVIDRTQTKLTSKIPKKFCLGKLFIRLELDSDSNQFQFELDRLRLFEQTQPKKKTKKSSRRSSILKTFSPEETITTDSLVVQIYLSIIQARNLPSNGHNVRNPYFVCRAFWNEQPIHSIVSWGCLTPKFNFEQKIPLILTKSTLEKMHKNFLIIELWDKKISGPSDQLIGITKISLEQFFVSFKDKQISQVLLRAQYPVISTDAWLPIIDPFTATSKSHGEIQVLLAMGTPDQITAVQIAHTGNSSSSSSHSNEQTITTKKPIERSTSSLIEHYFEISIESIHGLRAFESMVWGESDCFIQYSFPTQQEQNRSSFQLRTIRTNATLCTSDPTFNDSNKFRYILSTNEPLHKYFYAACQGTSTIETNISFEVWTRFYYPNIRDQLLAKGKLQAAKLCGMTTMLNSERDNKSTQSFRIPLEIVRDDSNNHQHISTPNYGGDLLISVVYKRNIFQKTDEQILTNRFLNSQSQVCLSVGIIRACGLKYAAQCQTRYDNRLNYPSQVGLNTYAKLSISFLSDQDSRTTRTVARSFVPEFNHSIDFPVSLISNQSISLAELLENGQLKIDLYHQMSSSNETNDKRSLDIYLCSANISLKELISRHTGIKGWYPLTNTGRMNGAEIAEQCLGGLELFVRFGQQDDRRKVLDSAKKLGWNDDNYQDEENFLDNDKDLGCLMTVTIERIQFPIQLATRPGKDRLDEQTTVFVQYRLYDKMPILTQRKKPIIDRSSVQCDLKFHKEHLFLCSAPFLWYLREEKFEIQIWTSDNSSGEFSSTDKLLGSIYVDLNSLSNRKRKSHRLNAILPMFKHGCKDLGGAWTQIHVTIDKSKDFNEVRNRNEDEIEFDHSPQINSSQQSLPTNKNVFSVIVHIEQAAHLSTIYSKQENAHIVPNPYVTYSTADSEHLCRTHILTSTSKPVWNYQKSIRLSLEHLFNEKKNFLLKVWHKLNADIETRPESSGDKVLGFVSIDLSPLLSGLQQISGWYNIVDTIGNIQGQLKISIVPQEDLFQYKRMKYKINQTQPKIDSHRSTSSMNSSNSTVPTLFMNDLSARSNTTDQTTIIDDENNNRKSFLMNNLHRQLGELDMITERLKARLHSGSEISSTSTGRCTSVPPFTNMNTHRQEIDSTRSTSTIQSDFLEHFPESLSGRPLMSNGLNVTDALSYHNDQVRLAQELMTKANNLLESSKDFFNKSAPPPPPPLPPPLPETTTTTTVVERSFSPSPPPVLPNFNNTTEFHIRQASPIHENQSPEHQQQQQQNASIIWSDDDDEDNDNDEQNQSFLPIGLPPTQHRLLTQTTESSSSPLPPPLPPMSTSYEETPEVDVIHIRPLNNLSAFNFDCQQLNESFSPQVSVRRTIFSEEQQQQQQPQQSSSSSSSSVSSTSDTSVIDSNWVEQRRPVVPERPPSRQAPSRSPHLTFLDRPLPNFFPTNREMEASMKHVSQALTTTNNSSSRKTPNPPSPSNTVMKTIIERLRTKSSNDLLRTASPADPTLLQPNETSNVTRLEKIFKTKYTSSN